MHLCVIREENGQKAQWEHIGDGRIEWISVQHRRENITVPRTSWKREVAVIVFPIDHMPEDQKRQITCSNALSKVIHHGRPTARVSDWEIWKSIVSLTREFVHEPSGTRPRGPFSNDIHEFRMEILSYLHAVSDVYNISPESVNDWLFNITEEEILNKYPEKIRPKLAKTIAIWKNPQPYMRKVLEKWRKDCVPLVLFECTAVKTKEVRFSVIFHDMTFVRPNRYEPGMHKQLQRLFFNIFPSTLPKNITQGPMDSSFLKLTLQHSKKKANPVTTTGDKFVSQLLPYQQRCVGWLRDREQRNSTSSWGWSRHQLKDGFVFYTSVFGHLSLTAPNSTVYGGLLAQDVGMGKTVEMLAHIATSPASGPTLVVLPTTMLSVWISEAAKHTPSLSVIKFHGARRTKDMSVLKAADIVLTTYKIVVNETSQHVPTIGSVRWGANQFWTNRMK